MVDTHFQKKESTMRQTYRRETKSITIINPRGDNGGFNLRLESVDGNGHKSTSSKIFKQRAELLKINELYKNRSIDFNRARVLVEDLKLELLKEIRPAEDKIELNKSNTTLINAYYKKVFLRQAEERDYKQNTIYKVRANLTRIERIFHDTPIATSSREKIVNRWKRQNIPSEGKKRLATRVNSILKYAKRDFKVGLTKSEKSELNNPDDRTWITEKDLVVVVSEMKFQHDKQAVRVLFYTGMRIGEMYGIKGNKIEKIGKANVLNIKKAKTRDKVLDLPKGYKKRKVYIPKMILAEFLEWSGKPRRFYEDDFGNFGRRLKNTCRKLWPDDETKHVSPHGMRRSFAKFMRSKGSSISDIASLMGDTEDTVRNSYLGHDRDPNFWNRIDDEF